MRLPFLFLLTLLVLSVSCKDDDPVDEFPTTGPLYFKYTLNGQAYSNSDNEGEWGGYSTGDAVWTWATIRDMLGSTFSIYFEDQTSVSGEDWEMLELQRIPFNTADKINADFDILVGFSDYYTRYASNPVAENYIEILDVYELTNQTDPDTNEKLYRVTAKFQCNTAESPNDVVMRLTNGSFSFIFQEIE